MTGSQIVAQLQLALAKRGVYVQLTNRVDLVEFQVANEFGCARNTVTLWHTRFLQHGLAGLQDAPRSGRPPSFSPPTNNSKSLRWPPAKPAILVEPGKPEKREHEYIRHGARCLIASFVVPTGKVVWDLGVTRTSVDFATHLAHVASQFPDQKRCHWVLDNLNTHWSLEVCKLLAKLNDLPFHKKDLRTGKQRRAFLTDADHKHVFHFTP
jgi:hypothetical protein